MPYEGFHERLKAAIEPHSAREVGEIIGRNPEIVRRILGGQDPPLDFIRDICRAFDVSADWLLIARGPMRRSEVRLEALRQIPAIDLVGSLDVCVRRLLDGGKPEPDTGGAGSERPPAAS